MKIGIDLRALQTGHKFRGIGEVAKQTTNRILSLGVADKNGRPEFIFYEYDDDDPKKLLDIPKGIEYTVVKLGRMPERNLDESQSEKLARTYRDFFGAPITDSAKSDVFLQFDYAFGVPTNTKTLLIKHDLIPLIFWNKYFESAWVPFKNKALRTTLRTIFANYRYKYILKRGVNSAKRILTVSQSTKDDVVRLLGVKPSKIGVVHLGVDVAPAKTDTVAHKVKMPTKPYLLFIGAGDARRRVDDLVAAYNNLKADGNDIQLVLVGENFASPEKIPNIITRNAVMQSSYGDDLLTLGYVDDATKQELLRGALAYVYPTKYEGFGIPVLEAMLQGCPVITYRNSSIPEVAGDHALYAHDWMGIMRSVKQLLGMPKEKRKRLTSSAKIHAEAFTWDRTAKTIYEELTGLVR